MYPYMILVHIYTCLLMYYDEWVYNTVMYVCGSLGISSPHPDYASLSKYVF